MDYNQMRKKLEEILLSNDIEKKLREEEIFIFETIPELKNTKNFDQKSEYHCYDVWNHTIYAIKNSKNELEFRIVLLLHDIGKPFSYQEDNGVRHFKGHARKSAEISKNILKNLGYEDKKIEELIFLIGNHATTINDDIIDENNIEKYMKLLYIQYCDASAYAPEFAKQTINNLDKIKKKIEIKSENFKTNKHIKER